MTNPMTTSAKQQRGDRRTFIRRRAWGMLLLALLASVVVVAVAQVSHVRFDATEDRIYSLSDSTRAIVSKLDEPVMVHAYITADLPQPYGRLHRFVEDMLMSYHDAAGGKLGYNIVDPATDANLSASLNAMQIPKVRVQVVEDDQAQVKQGYLAIVIEYLDKKEVIPVVQSEEGFEYLLTRKIKKLTGKGRVKVGVVSGFGAHGMRQMRQLQQIAGDDYEFIDVSPDVSAIPEDVYALIVAGVDEKPSLNFRYRLDQYRMSGRGLFVLAGNVQPQLMRGFHVQSVDPYANQWLASDLGVVIDPGLVLDRRATRVVVNQQQGMVRMQSAVDYPFVINAMQLDATLPVSKGLESVTVPFASPLLWTEKVKGGKVLVASSNASAVQSGPPFDVDPLQPIQARFSGMNLRPSNLILAYDGAADSTFAAPPEGISSASPHLPHSAHTRLLVAGAPAMLDDDFLDGANSVFALNALDWLAGDDALIALRSRGMTDRPLADIDRDARAAWKGLWMFGMPALMVFAGLWRWWILRRRAQQQTAHV